MLTLERGFQAHSVILALISCRRTGLNMVAVLVRAGSPTKGKGGSDQCFGGGQAGSIEENIP